MGRFTARFALFVCLFGSTGWAGLRDIVEDEVLFDESWLEWSDPELASLAVKGRACSAARSQILAQDSDGACTRMRRSLHLMEKYPHEILKHFKTGMNFAVYFKNEKFYKDRIRRRLNACNTGKIDLKCVGRCGTDQETLAYVLVTFGFVHSTINICDEYFEDHDSTRVGTLSHEYGRLESIGDSPNLDTNNIYVWDAITRALSNDYTYEVITNPKAP